MLPVGAEIELPGSPEAATVERVRLPAPVHHQDPMLSHPAYVCLDVRVPAGYDPTMA